MKKATVFVVFALALAARATDYTWSGAGDGASWTDSANWGGGGGYPASASDVARFKQSATVSIDVAGKLTVGCIVLEAGAGTVTVGGVDGAVLDPARGAVVNGNGFVVLAPSRLVLDVPVESAARIDKWLDGGVVFRKGVTSAAAAYPFLLDNGSVTLEGDAAMDLPDGNLEIANYTPSQEAVFTLKDDASLYAKFIVATINKTANTAVGHVVQDGDGTKVTVWGNIELAKAANHAMPTVYELKRGCLDVGGNVWLGIGGSPAKFVQTGGSMRVNSFLATNAVCGVQLGGGTMYVNYDISDRASESFAFDFSGGTLVACSNRNCNCNVPFSFSGSPTVEVAQAAYGMYLRANAAFAPGTVFTKSGAGELRIERDAVVDGSLVVAGGVFFVGDGTDMTDVELSAKDGDHSAWPVTVKSGAVFHLNTINSRVTRPLDLTIESGGKVRFSSAGPYNRSIIVAHSLTVGGETKAKGRYTPSNLGTYIEGLAQASVVVPYVWTGDGDGTSWSDGANWDGGAVPPASAPVDISRAGGATLSLGGDTTVSCLVFNPQGSAKAVAISGNGTLTLDCTSYSPCVFVGPGREVTLDVALAKADQNQMITIVGGGRTVVKRRFPLGAGNLDAAFTLDGELLFAGANEFATSATYKSLIAFTHEIQGRSKVVIGDGAIVSGYRIVPCGKGFVAADLIVQTGGTVSLHDVFFTRHNLFGRSSFAYVLSGGTLTLEDCFCLGTLLSTSLDRWPGGDFVMDGGAVTLAGFKLQSDANRKTNGNHVYLNGGDVYLKSGFLADTNTGNLKETVATDFPVSLGGATIHSTASWSCPFETTLSGTGGNTVFDTAGFNATFSNTVVGEGGLVKRGVGTLAFTGATSFTGAVAVEGGTLSLAGTHGGVLESLSFSGDGTLNTGSGTLTVKNLYVCGAMRKAGTYGTGGTGLGSRVSGTLVVLEGTDPETFIVIR